MALLLLELEQQIRQVTFNRCDMEEVSHKQIYDRLVAVESKVDKIDEQTKEVVLAFQSAKGAFIALDWLARFSGKIIKIGILIAAVGTTIVVAFERWKQ